MAEIGFNDWSEPLIELNSNESLDQVMDHDDGQFEAEMSRPVSPEDEREEENTRELGALNNDQGEQEEIPLPPADAPVIPVPPSSQQSQVEASSFTKKNR